MPLRDLRVVQDQAPGPLATTVKLGRASAALVLCPMLNAAIGRRRPLSSTFPRSSRTATASTARATRLLIRICPSLASAHNRGRGHLRLKYPSSGLGARDLNAVSIICGALFLLGDAGLSDRH